MYRILIVDDEEPVLDSFSFILSKYQSDFTLCGKARNGNDALKMIRELVPDVVGLVRAQLVVEDDCRRLLAGDGVGQPRHFPLTEVVGRVFSTGLRYLADHVVAGRPREVVYLLGVGLAAVDAFGHDCAVCGVCRRHSPERRPSDYLICRVGSAGSLDEYGLARVDTSRITDC